MRFRALELIPATVVLGVVALTASAVPASGAPSPWDAAPVASTAASGQECASLLFVGIRGSGEDAPFGRTVGGVRDEIAAQWKGTGSVRQVYLDYPAAAAEAMTDRQIEGLLLDDPPPAVPYFESTEAGRTELVRVLADSARRCPREAVALVGFSQGAQVITRALTGPQTGARLAGVLLLGNPDHYPGDNASELDGEVDTGAIGLTATLTYLRALADPEQAASRSESVPRLLSAVFDLHQGKVTSARISEVMRQRGHAIGAWNYPFTWSVCAPGDVVCDSAGAMSRVLSGSSTLGQELAEGTAVHRGYVGAAIEASVAALTGALEAATVTSLAQAPSESPTAGTSPPSTLTGRGTDSNKVSAALVAVAGLLVGLATGLVIGSRRGRPGGGRRPGRDSHPSPEPPLPQ